ncbi:MAG TPA: RNA polymerase factor sigma-54 [Neobacillus sp.]
MNLKAGLWQQQTLKLAMTQELSQAIALLQYSAQELTLFLENKALENPLLQIENGNVQPVNPLIDRNRNQRVRRTAEKDWIEQIADQPFSMEEQLISQLNIKSISSTQVKVIRHLIQNFDVNGYFIGDLTEIANLFSTTEAFVEDCLAIIQTLEPAGIGARNLQECLLLQLENNELAQKIISEYFVLFAEKKWKKIAKELQVSLKEIQEIFDDIQLLNPKPGARLQNDNTSYIVPDAIIERTNEGLTVRMFDDPLPRISFNDGYYKKFSTTQDQQVSKFLHDKVQDYHWILKSIEQRKETLMKVVAKIVEKQATFFQKGIHHLIPMTMKEIATELEIHESTVSRAVREKYVQTPVGTFMLKSFFTSTIQTVQNETTSSTQVKNTIALIINKEDKHKPLSDQEIVELLKDQEGMVVSRRTIAKYREQLGIPSSSKRKRFN